MAINWSFDANDYEENNFLLIPAGDHRVRIRDVSETQSRNGNDMLKITLDVSGHNSSLWFYLVFMPDNAKMTNQRIGEICESFGLSNPGPQAILNAKGKLGACRVKHEDYQGDKSAKVSYFLTRKKQENLPLWVEPSGSSTQPAAPVNMPAPGTAVTIDAADLPF